MSKLPISVFIITKDEEDRVPLAIKSVRDWVDEVIVVDSGSSDKTMEVAKKLGATTLFNEWKGYGPQKVFSEGLCKNKWLLNIDADEEISPELASEIQKEFAGGTPKYKAYSVIIKDVSRFSLKAGKFTSAHIQLRLYHKDYAGFKDSTVHDSVVLKDGVNEKIYKFKNYVLHRSFRSYAHAVAKINRYSSMQAEDMFARGRRPSALRIVTEPFVSFLKGYFIKRHCFLGVEGVIEGVLYAFGRTLRLAKARELWVIQDSKKGEGI
jgi:glycosyltransferase involved in cell wall biosynthesis